MKSKVQSETKKTYQIAGTKFVVDSKYQILKQIGSGAYGVVVSAIDRTTNKKYAIKKVLNAFDDLVDAKRIVRQIKLLKFFKHEDLLDLKDLLKPSSRNGFNDIYIVTQLMQTDLHRVIYSNQQLSVQHIQFFTFQIIRGICHMHSANVIHRDLKPQNILTNNDLNIKICDLGLCRGYNEQEQEKTEYVVTRWYRAPEVILNASQYTSAIDIWSIGCIIAQLLGRTPLFPGQCYLDQIQRIISIVGTPKPDDLRYITNENAIKYIKSLPKRTKQKWEQLFPQITPQLSDLLTKMLNFNPDKRIKALQCLEHPFFKDFEDQLDGTHISKSKFDWNWDNFELSRSKLQKMVYEESLVYHPEKVEKQVKVLTKKENVNTFKEHFKKYKYNR